MEAPDGLNGITVASRAPTSRSTSGPTSCPHCGRARTSPPLSDLQLFGGQSAWRCRYCSSRSIETASGATRIETCTRCGLPRVLSGTAPERYCPDCHAGRFLEDHPDSALTRATETEVRTVLASRLSFVGAPKVNAYLDQVARRMAREIEGSRAAVHVQLFDDETQRTLALPSGTLLVSRGTLQRLESEAELAFVLAHEIAHLASGSTDRLLFRMALRGMAERGRGEHRDAWGRAAQDLMTLGHGSALEHEADRRALVALLAVGYDPGAIEIYLDRIERAIVNGEPEVAALDLAHPTPAERRRRLRAATRPATGLPPRTNREVFRRLAGTTVLTRELTPIPAQVAPLTREKPGRWLWAGLALLILLVLTGLVLGVFWLLH